ILEFLPADRTELAQTIACVVGRYHDASQTFREGIEEIGRYVETYDAPSPVRVGLLTILA
ncbi:MAG: hypothetical protein GWN85_35105, partial [Gemmatimonadetes bacterium]|nr:hypothetical protein [Gemmatimonadota bacterium]NIR40554.1 hypothetical protein [Actinomycetota bacterium]NIS35464.1 hypothetical protein [Actinomycetota bacterium]NIU70133.1 hypothetical protein [Actinomycetota bacterium]NIW32017.1 hypothetical protein [Actinomycetota bacterium]